jgi:hypothetical protein
MTQIFVDLRGRTFLRWNTADVHERVNRVSALSKLRPHDGGVGGEAGRARLRLGAVGRGGQQAANQRKPERRGLEGAAGQARGV